MLGGDRPMMIPIEAFREVAEAWLDEYEDRAAAFELLSRETGIQANSWRRRLSDDTYVGRRGTDLALGWYCKPEIEFELVDEFLKAIDGMELWHLPPLDAYAGERPEIICHDCGKVCEPGDYRPLDLMRVVPDAPGGKRARPGGRRFRWYDLCRRCAAVALISRDGTTRVYENGKRKRSGESYRRKPPKRGGRPRLLTDDELRAAHAAYLAHGLSIGELARRLTASRSSGSFSGYYSSIRQGWRRLNLSLRDVGEQIGLSKYGTDGTLSRRFKERCRGEVRHGPNRGRRCPQYVRRELTDTGSRPAADGLCWNHAHARREAA